jgi:hypothetical protein
MIQSDTSEAYIVPSIALEVWLMLARAVPAVTPIKRRGRCAFRQGDVTKAIRAVIAAGLPVACAKISADGEIVVIPGKPSDPDPDHNEWDEA